MIEFQRKNEYNFNDLRKIMEILRGEGGCPWDREQTHESIRNDLIEETYEVIEAIDKKDSVLLEEELGDVMLQVMFHARMSEEDGIFNIDDVCDGICKKMILRHPHIFGDVKADTSAEVLANWEKIKKKEKSRKTVTENLQSVPKMLPALMRAQKIGKKAKNFDFASAESAFEKVSEECKEVSGAISEENYEHIKEEIGDLLFSVANLGRKLNVDCEEALNLSSDKFIDRFSKMENEIIKSGKNIENMNQKEMDEYWDMVKITEKEQKN